jgi:hypothetical protein
VRLTLTDSRSRPKLIITIAPDEKIELDLNDCSYVEESSEPGQVDCINNTSEGQTVIIMDRKQQCVDLLEKMRDYLENREKSSSLPPRRRSPPPSHRPSSPRRRSPSPRRRSPSPPYSSPEPIDSKNVNDLIKALNGGNEKEAAEIARALARDKQPVQFALNMINESGNTVARPKPEPVIEPIKLKLSIESFLTGNQDNRVYDVAILPQTTIANLKQLVQTSTGIAPDQQYWYINRDLLSDGYAFGVTQRPRLDDKTALILYIAKPQNA